MNFAYSGKIQLEPNNVQAILVAANYLHLQVNNILHVILLCSHIVTLFTLTLSSVVANVVSL